MIFPLARETTEAALDLDHATYVVHKSTSDTACWGGRLLSLKVGFRGRVRFHLYDQMQYSLGPGEYLILNADKEYDIYEESREPVDFLAIYFEQQFASDALRALQGETMDLLDNPVAPLSQPVDFFERVFPGDECLVPMLQQLKAGLPSGAYSLPWLEEKLHELIEAMLNGHLAIYSDLEDLSSIRHSLREEIYRRLYRAHDFAMSSLDRKQAFRNWPPLRKCPPATFCAPLSSYLADLLINISGKNA